MKRAFSLKFCPYVLESVVLVVNPTDRYDEQQHIGSREYWFAVSHFEFSSPFIDHVAAFSNFK